MWFRTGHTSFDTKEISSVVMQVDDGEEKVVIFMKNNQQITVQPEGSVTPAIAYEKITSLLESEDERDERIMVNGFELTKMILSELKSITQELKLISQNLRRL